MPQEEIDEWNSLDLEDRPKNYLPKQFTNLGSVPGYAPLIDERFARCLDLYPCPRALRKRVVDP